MRSKVGYSKKQWEQVRAQVKQAAEEQGMATLCESLSIKANTVYSFLLGRSKGLSEENFALLLGAGVITEPTPEQENAPIENYAGEVVPTATVAKDKGYSGATIRNYCKSGRLNYTKKGTRYYVIVDEKLAALKETELATLRKKAAEQEVKITALEQQLQAMQLEFTYEDSESVQELEEASQDVLALIEENKALKKNVSALYDKIAEQREEIKSLDTLTPRQVQYERQAYVAQVNQHNLELKKENDELKEWNKELSEKVSRFCKAADQELEEADTLRKENYELKGKIDQFRIDIKDLKNTASERIDGLVLENKKLREAIEEYQRTVSRQANKMARIGEPPVSTIFSAI